MGIFDKVKKAEVSGTGKYISPGVHVLEISEIKSFNGYGGETVVFEFNVIESTPDMSAFDEQKRQKADNKGPYANPKSVPYTTHSEGESVSYVCKDGGGLAGEMAVKNIKGFLDVITGGHADDLDGDDWEAITGNSQIARGTVVRCTAFDRPTKSGDKMITNMNWTLVTPSEALAQAETE